MLIKIAGFKLIGFLSGPARPWGHGVMEWELCPCMLWEGNGYVRGGWGKRERGGGGGGWESRDGERQTQT